MKKLVCIVFALILFNACQKKEPQRYFSESAEIESSKKLLSYFATYNYDGIKEIYSDSVKIYDNSVKAASLSDMIAMIKDNEQMSEYMKIKDSADYEMVITKDNETWVNCWYAIVGKFKGLDKEFVIPCHSTFQFKDGKIVEEYSYYNTLSVYQEMEKMADTTAVDTMATK
jgi:hypothetical protein